MYPAPPKHSTDNSIYSAEIILHRGRERMLMEEGESRCVGQGWIRTDGDLLIRGVAEIRRDAQGIGWTT